MVLISRMNQISDVLAISILRFVNNNPVASQCINESDVGGTILTIDKTINP